MTDMSLWKEFKTFAVKGNVIDLAVAVVIGAAFSKIVTALVEGVVMPLVGKALPTGRGWESFAPGGIKVGTVLGATIDFLIVALVLFAVVVKLMGALQRRKGPEAPSTKPCAECLEIIPIEARRCRACTSQQPS
jgi:large conductance mechanosensitive channel